MSFVIEHILPRGSTVGEGYSCAIPNMSHIRFYKNKPVGDPTEINLESGFQHQSTYQDTYVHRVLSVQRCSDDNDCGAERCCVNYLKVCASKRGLNRSCNLVVSHVLCLLGHVVYHVTKMIQQDTDQCFYVFLLLSQSIHGCGCKDGLECRVYKSLGSFKYYRCQEIEGSGDM